MCHGIHQVLRHTQDRGVRWNRKNVTDTQYVHADRQSECSQPKAVPFVVAELAAEYVQAVDPDRYNTTDIDQRPR